MTIELFMGIAAKAIVGSAAGKLAALAIDKGRAKLFPEELEKALGAGVKAAKIQEAQIGQSGLFGYCTPQCVIVQQM